MKKHARITMPYLISFILAIVLLVIIIYGVYSDGFGPLIDNIESRFNEVLILLNIRDGGVPVCGDSFPQEIEGVGSGDFYPCEDNCAFVINNPERLLDFSNFSIDKNGFVVKSGDGVFGDNYEAYSLGYDEVMIYKDAYDKLMSAIDNYLDENSIDKKEFVKIMDFNTKGKFFFEVDGSDSFLNKVTLNLFSLKGHYEYNGISWEDAMFDSEVFDKLLDAYKKDYDIYYGYERLPELKRDVSEYRFKKWFFNLVENCNRYSIYEDNFFNNGNLQINNGDELLASYNCIDDSIDYGDIFVASLYKKYMKDEKLFWFYRNLNEKHYFVSDDLMERKRFVPKGLSEVGFKDKLNVLLGEYKDSYNKVYSFGNALKNSGDFDIEYKNVNDDYIFTVIFLKDSNFGIYYDNGNAVFVDRSLNELSISDFIGLGSDEWGEFININKIYDYFKLRRCGI